MADREPSAPTVPAPVDTDTLRLATVASMRGDWNSAWFTVTRKGMSAHLGLSSDALWVEYKGELRRYPLRALTTCERDARGSELRLRFYSSGEEVFQAFRFPRRAEAQEWHDLIRGRKDSLPNAPLTPDDGPAAVPLLLMPGTADVPTQSEGELESQHADRGLARLALQVHATQAGADAMTNLREEQATEEGRTVSRFRGTASRALDPVARHDLRARWRDAKIARLGNAMLLFVVASYVLTLLVSAAVLVYSRSGRGFPPAPAGSIDRLLRDTVVAVSLIHVCPFVLAFLTRWWKRPELLRPTGAAILPLGARPVAALLGAVAAGVLPGGWTNNALFVLTLLDPVSLFLLVASWHLCKAAWKAYHQCAKAVPEATLAVSSSGRGLEVGAATVAVVLGVVALGGLAWSQYAVANPYSLTGHEAWQEHHARVVFQQGASLNVSNLPVTERAFRRSLGMWEKLSDDYSDKPEYQHNRATTCLNLGMVLLFLGRMEEGTATIRQAVGHYDHLTSEFPEYERHLRDRAFAEETLNQGQNTAPFAADNDETMNGQHMERLGRHEEVVALFRKALASHETKQKEFKDPAVYRTLLALKQNRLAWVLATCTNVKLRDPKQAVELARKAVENSPREGAIWNTLGAAYYRAGNWQECVKAIERSLKLSMWNEGFDWLFLAMANHQMGKPVDAKQWYDKAEAWMDRLDQGKFHHPRERQMWMSNRGECERLREEAERLIQGKEKAGK